MVTSRDAIHLGPADPRRPAGSDAEPILLLHPFMMSSYVWTEVAPLLAGTGRFEVFAPTMAGHNGGPATRSWFLDTNTMANHIETQLDELGWTTAHIVGNSLGGWVAFELERRGRARTVTAIAPAGGWRDLSPVKFEIVGKFLAGGPVLLAARWLGPMILRLPYARRVATWPISGPADGPPEDELLMTIEDATHCPAYIQLLIKSLLAPGLKELAHSKAPLHLVTCEYDRVLPHPRYSRHFHEHLPEVERVTHLDGVGHIPMLEAPDLIAQLITEFVDAHTAPRPEERHA